eukprot:749826-Hanusia_phi.AAC.2
MTPWNGSEQDEARSRHSKMPSSLTVHIHGAKNLPKMDSFLGKVGQLTSTEDCVIVAIGGPIRRSQRDRWPWV